MLTKLRYDIYAVSLVVSGLNHAMDHSGRGKLDREVDAAYGANADSVAPATKDTLQEMKNSLPILKKLYPTTGNRGMYAQPYMETANNGVSIAKTFAYDTDNYKSSTTTYFRGAFKSYRLLARTMLHEFGHGVHYFNGDFNKYRRNHTTAQTDSWKERYAFNYAFVNGGAPYKNDPWYLMNK